MRILLVNNHCITDPTAGVTQSLRTLMEWLAEAGHACHILTTSRFESPVPFTIHNHLRTQNAPAHIARADHTVPYHTDGVPITLHLVAHDEHQPDPWASLEFVQIAKRLMIEFAPDLVLACNGHPMIREVLKRAKARGVTTVFTLRGYGYDSPDYFTHVDAIFTCSPFVTAHYRQLIGLESTPIPPAINWAEVVAPLESRRYVTFVQPAAHKGLLVFLRLADMLHTRRPDIPLLVVESNQAMAGFGLDQWPWIRRLPPVSTPAEWLALTRIVLVPSVWAEPFGRVAVEAMINGIPALVSDRGGLPEALSYGGLEALSYGGIVLPIPEWMTPYTFHLPTEADMEGWYAWICRLWDDSTYYHAVSGDAKAVAQARYSELVVRQAHVEFLQTALDKSRSALAHFAE